MPRTHRCQYECANSSFIRRIHDDKPIVLTERVIEGLELAADFLRKCLNSSSPVLGMFGKRGPCFTCVCKLHHIECHCRLPAAGSIASVIPMLSCAVALRGCRTSAVWRSRSH